MNFFQQDTLTAVDAKEHAQFLAFAPIAFQAARALVNLGLLAAVEKARPHGLSSAQAAAKTGLSNYGARVLLEAGLGLGLLTTDGENFRATRAAWFLLHDEMTRVNFDFVNDVCYLGAFDLEESVREGKPVGLKVFGEWPSIYEALAHLPPHVRASWLKFDHFYSDAAFDSVLPIVFKNQPRRLLDIGGNTGRWALRCVRHSSDVHVCIADLPGQLRMAEAETRARPGGDRISGFPINILAPDSTLPENFDAIWMSQFLDCFSEEQIRAILAKCRRAIDPAGRAFILEPLWDRQKFRAAASSLQFTSLYFTALANGNSQMYNSQLLLSLVLASGFEIEEQHDQLGVGHTLLVCRPA
ncbi:MAG TPA: methyltransferase [Verrucomicrobiae bacterium]|nr:methyltransferase [Verrucomicrobiae bacterium]